MAPTSIIPRVANGSNSLRPLRAEHACAGQHQQVIEPGQRMEKTGLETVGTVAWVGERRNGKGQQ
jgi:hypothetical protein